MSKPKFTTKRFDVFKMTCERYVETCKGGMPRDVYVAFPRFDDIPRPLAYVTIFHVPCYIEWIEVELEWRRRGIATEVIDGLEKYLGHALYGYGVTPEGEAFVKATGKEKL